MKRIFRKDERGITLQTLIVTAVLVLMAGAAGVVIVSITNSQADNLEGQNAGIEARCEPWEIFDPTLAAAGRGGDGNGGLTSSAIGCRRVCYAKSRTPGVAVLDADADKLVSTASGTPANDWELKFSRSDITATGKAAAGGAAAVAAVGVVTGDRTAGTATKLVGTHQRIEVANNNRYCQVWDDSSDSEVAELRSS